jgi:hypothetical protein
MLISNALGRNDVYLYFVIDFLILKPPKQTVGFICCSFEYSVSWRDTLHSGDENH